MKPLGYVFFLAFVLSISTGISFVGYRYLALANEYRKANFEHVNAVFTSLDIIRKGMVPSARDVQQLEAALDVAQEQAIWCLDNLSPFEHVMLKALGAEDALTLCEEGIKVGESAKDLIDDLKDPGKSSERSFTETLIVYGEILREIEELRDLSVAFQPHVTTIQSELEVIVKSGTAVVSTALLILSISVARQLTRAQRRITRQSTTCGLTQLTNRRGLDQILARQTDAAETILSRIDLDRFKQVNDILGHAAGDFVLKHVAGLMRKHARPDDVVARVGGDEFVILFASGTTLADAKAVTEDILGDVAKPVRYGDKQCVFGASFGLASSGVQGLGPADLLNAADKALYEVKRSGRGAIAVYSDKMHGEVIRERALADRFKEALERREIVPYFQTQHLATDLSLYGAEVLARWEHPTDGILAPDRFLGIAKQLGLEAELDRTIFVQTVEFLAKLKSKGRTVPRIAFNVSAGRITDPSFVSDVGAVIPEDRDRFAFEILETVYYEEAPDILMFTVDAIKDMGFQIHVDDFGSGHASINSVLNIEPDVLKIDRNIVRPIVDSPQALRMTASIVELANALNVEVIAEGVECAQKASLLRDMGCHALQGYHFSKPMSAAAFEVYLMRREDTLERAG